MARSLRACADRTPVIWIGSSAPVRMCRMLILLTLVSINIHASSQTPPRLTYCRPFHKAKSPEEYNFDNIDTCGATVSLPITDGNVVNVTDIRNCANYFTCTGFSCKQCPCPPGQTFSPQTFRCESTLVECACVRTTLRTTTVAETTTQATEKIATTVIIVKDAGSEPRTDNGSGDNSNNAGDDKEPVSTEVIIIAGIVSATVIVIVVIVMAVFCWQRRQSQHNASKNISSDPKLPPHIPQNGYSATMPQLEKHVYAEIDERMINGSKHWQHGGTIGPSAPPLPDHEPPLTSPAFTMPCPHHNRHTRTDSGMGSADTSFTTNYPRRTFQPINPAHSIQLGVSYNERQPNAHFCGGDQLYHGREDSSVSSDSQYSNSTSLESHDIDLRTPLQAMQQKHNYVSKQVYI